MSGSIIYATSIQGLTAAEVSSLQRKYGKNIFQLQSSRRTIHILWDIFKEPMFILLAIACSLYFILGQESEGIMMLVAMFLVSAISFYQEVKSSNAVKALQQLTAPKVIVIRDGKEMTIQPEDLVPGDIILLNEGMTIPADGIIVQENDLTVNESVITGESLPAEKTVTAGSNTLYQGSTINSGKCIARITATGNATVLGRLGKAMNSYNPSKTILQLQMNRFVRRLALFGLAAFFIILFVNYLHQKEWMSSLLVALTLAMSAIPEEIPVAFSSFMALGSYKMSKLGIISRQPQIVENLGAVSVICLDKTGTITENRMQVKVIYDYKNDSLIELEENLSLQDNNLLHYAVLASEKEPFDAMEKAILEAYRTHTGNQKSGQYKMIYEYPLIGRPPMMTHVYEHSSSNIAAAKGAIERIIHVCRLTDAAKDRVTKLIRSTASKGYRVIAVASAVHKGLQFPILQDDFDWQFEGFLALYDPPKKNIPVVLKQFYDAKIDIKMLTGDHPATAINIAEQVGIYNHDKCVTGEEILNMKEDELKRTVKTTSIFARMFPEAKLKVVNVLKDSGAIVAMTGDGVNDGPALRSANIGIAMGEKGTEIARQAADLVLTDDNLDRMVNAIKEGRKIFSNLKKAIRYIISIHIPIILTASLPVILGWHYPNIFTPIHVIFMELIMGPTCSVFFEREPVEADIMGQSPRNKNDGLFSKRELLMSITQGIVITSAVLGLYYYSMTNGSSIEQTRTIVFTTLILSNVFLTFVNRSFTQSVYYTIKYKNNLVPVILIISALFLSALHFIPAVRALFQLTSLTLSQFLLSLVVAFISVVWVEIYKIVVSGPMRSNNNGHQQ